MTEEIEYLNPWVIEVDRLSDTTLRLNLVNRDTGEMRQVTFDVETLNTYIDRAGE